MKTFPMPKRHSQTIARWRLYLWFRYLETGDDTQFIIPEDKDMADKATFKRNRMEVLRHIISIISTASLLSSEVNDKSVLSDTALRMLRTRQKVDNDCYKAVMAIAQEPIPSMHYSRVNDQNEIEVSNSEGKPVITGTDVLALFDSKKHNVIKYDGRYVTAKNDPSGYCCLYYVGSHRQLEPITGHEAKIIAAQVMADATEFKFQTLKEPSIMLIQGYKTDGTPDRCAEYYTKDSITNKIPALTYRQQSRKDICAPLHDIIDDIKVGNFKCDRNTITDKDAIELINKIIDMIERSSLDDNKLSRKVMKYKATIDCLFKQEQDNYYKVFYKKYQAQPQHSDNTLTQYNKKNAWQELDEELLQYEQIPHLTEKVIKDTKNLIRRKINNRIKQIQSHMNNTEIEVDLISGSALQMRVTKDPEFVKIQRKEGSLIFNPYKKSNNYTITNVSQFIHKERTDLKVEGGRMSSDMIFPFELSITSKSGNTLKGSSSEIFPCSPGLRDFNEPDDAYSIADNMVFKLQSALSNSGCQGYQNETLSKLAYLVMVGAFFQGSYQFQGITAVVFDPTDMEGGMNSRIDGKNIHMFMSIEVNERGDAEIRLTHISRLLILDGNAFIPISDPVAVQSIIKVNLCDPNPRFTMTQRGAMKPTDNLRPESFFDEKPIPKPSLLAKYFGYTN